MHPVIDDPDGTDSQQVAHSENPLLRRAEFLLLCRRRRVEIFDRSIFDETAWDALLALYIEEAARRTVTVARLAGLIGARIPLVQRWAEYLEEQELVIRKPGGVQGRVGAVALTAKAHRDLELYLSRTLTLDSG